jgi:hypothetical protein
MEGWVNGHYLAETATPGATGRQIIRQDDGGPEVALRSSGEIEVIFPKGCVAPYDANGRKITAGTTCSADQLQRAREKVVEYRAE